MEDQPNYRKKILERLENRERKLKAVQTMFRNYSTLAEQLHRARRMRHSSSEEGSSNGNVASLQIADLKEEISTVYRLKSKNDQDLINANKKLVDTEQKLIDVTGEKEMLEKTVVKLNQKIKQMEADIKELTESNFTVNNERVALLATCNGLTTQKAALEKERISLVAKITELQLRAADLMDAEVRLQEEKAQLKIREQIANATAGLKDMAIEERIARAQSTSPELCEDFMMSDVMPSELKFRMNAHDGEVNDVEWLNDDTFATGGSDGKVRLWQVTGSKNEAAKTASFVGCNAAVNRLDFDTQRRLLLAASNDKTSRLWNMDNQRLLSTFSGHTDKVTAARLFLENRVVSGSGDRTIKLFDTSNLRCVKSYCIGSSVFDLITKCGPSHTNFASGHFDKKVRLWDHRQSDEAKIIELNHRITSLDVSLDGLTILASSRDDTLSVIDVRNFAILHLYSADQYRSASEYSRAIFSSTGEYVVSGSATGAVFIWNTKTTKLEKVIRSSVKNEGNAVLSLSWNQSGRGLLVAEKQKTCVLWR